MKGAPDTCDRRRFCSFYIDGQRYAVDILAVREVHRPLAVTAVQRSSRLVRGLVNLRGQIITVLEPSVKLGIAPREALPTSRLVILKTNAELRERGHAVATCDLPVALWVDRIADVVAPGASGVEPVPTSAADREAGELIEGVVQLDGELVRILSPTALLRLERESTAAA